MKIISEITLKDLPKISLNNWYSGNHWTARKKTKDIYKILVKNQFKDVFKANKKYNVDYIFYFKRNALDATNCVSMVKLIEDIIFENDKYDIIEKISISSKKGEKNIVVINVYENIER